MHPLARGRRAAIFKEKEEESKRGILAFCLRESLLKEQKDKQGGERFSGGERSLLFQGRLEEKGKFIPFSGF